MRKTQKKHAFKDNRNFNENYKGVQKTLEEVGEA